MQAGPFEDVGSLNRSFGLPLIRKISSPHTRRARLIAGLFDLIIPLCCESCAMPRFKRGFFVDAFKMCYNIDREIGVGTNAGTRKLPSVSA